MKKLLIIYVLLAAIIFVGFKYFFKYAACEDMLFLLSPVNFLVSILSGSESIYSSTYGYFHPRLNITIEKGCSAYNFFMMLFLLCVYHYSKLIKGFYNIFLFNILSLLIAYVVVILANTARILSRIHFNSTPLVSQFQNPLLIHEAIGIINFFFFLIALNFILIKIIDYEKPTSSRAILHT
ncbi:MAG: exosortase K [Chloroherpetonaceae bacterium]|nr:exosortase K [Chloroherpetonaceae bacterium]